MKKCYRCPYEKLIKENRGWGIDLESEGQDAGECCYELALAIFHDNKAMVKTWATNHGVADPIARLSDDLYEVALLKSID